MEVKKIKRNGEEMWGYYLNYTDENNKIHKERKGRKDWNEKEAIEAQNKLIAKLKAGMTQQSAPVKSKSKNDITIEGVYNKYMNAKQESLRHGKRTEYDHGNVTAKHIFSKFYTEKEELNPLTNTVEMVKVPKPINKITQEDIRKWRNDLTSATFMKGKAGDKSEKHYSANQLIKVQSLCKAIFAYAKLHGYVDENPLDYFETIRKGQFTEESDKVYTVLSFADYDKLMTTIENHKTKKGEVKELDRLQDLLLFSCYFCLGIRLAECLQLTISDYCAERRMLVIVKNWDYVSNIVKGPKTANSVREMYCNDDVHECIMNLIEFYKKNGLYNKDLPLFSSYTKAKRRPGQTRLSPSTIRRRQEIYFKESNLEHIRIHDLRHSSASHLVNSGESLQTVAEHLGDSESIASAVYSHMNLENKIRVANLFNRTPKV
jgi:integrase